MKRAITVLLLTILLSFVATKGMVLEEDIISSLVDSDRTKKAVFDNYQKSSFFSSRIYVDIPSYKREEKQKLEKVFRENGYTKTSFINFEKLKNVPPGIVTSLLSKKELEKLLSDENIDKAFKTTENFINFPGSTDLLENFFKDPFSLRNAALSKFKTVNTKKNSDVLVFERKKKLDFQSVGKIYDYLTGLKDVPFLGGDFFAYENYKSIRDDIPFCLWLSIPLNILIFGLLCRNYSLILFLIVGTFISYASGLFLVRMFYPSFYAIVLAFTSTFVGFNNEYLIHLSGIKKNDRLKSLVGLGSAIGTTLIGFIILLFGKSIILKQIAIVSIGGMAGFILFLLFYQDHLSKVNFRTFKIRKFRINNKVMASFWALVLLFFLTIPLPSMNTDIRDFQYNSDTLKRNAELFTKKLSNVSLSNIHAVKVDTNPLTTFKDLKEKGELKGFHPLNYFNGEIEQVKSIGFLKSKYSERLDKLAIKIESLGIDKTYLKSSWLNDLKTLSDKKFLDYANQISNMAWFFNYNGESYLYYSSASKDSLKSYPVNPKYYYDTLLTSIQRNIFTLFLIGLVIMVLYITPIQKRLMKIAYIFVPLAVSLIILTLYFNYTNQNVNFIHIVGLSLVIAVALDYPALAVSSGFGDSEQSKIVLTGLSTILSFGVLVLAKHPVLQHLGLVVLIGATTSLLTCLFTTIPEETK